MQDLDAVVIGAGQAGLSISHELKTRGVGHVVVERGQIGEAWRRRWDNFRLVTPNWAINLPGFAYDGDDPDGFMSRDELVAMLERYAASFDAPVQTGVAIESVTRDDPDGFVVRTDQGELRARNLVLCTGAYQKPFLPDGAETLPDSVERLTIDQYRNPDALPTGRVLVVGSGQTGCQIAEELNDAGREVTLSCGRAAWAPREPGGKDVFWWVLKSGFGDQTLDMLPAGARLSANVLASGHGGGHDVNFPLLEAQGIELVGRFLGADGTSARFADNLTELNEFSNERYADLKKLVVATADKLGLDSFDMPDAPELQGPGRTEIDLADYGTVIFTGGFRPAYLEWLPWTDAFDADGFPIQVDGASAVVPGLFFMGVHFMRRRKSALLAGMADDATVVADKVAAAA
jgi:putative flavoprotein involved in K+ transport